MKLKQSLISGVLILLSVFFFTGCLEDDFYNLDEDTPNLPDNTYDGFEFNTTKNVDVVIKAYSYENKPIVGAYFEAYSTNPLTNYGTLVADRAQYLLFRGATNSQGIIDFIVSLPTYSDSMYLLSYYIGLEQLRSAAIVSDEMEFIYKINSRATLKSLVNSSMTPTFVNGFYILGSWNKYGVPDYLYSPGDHISTDFLEDVNASLPEYITLPESHPQYLAGNNDASLKMKEDGELWVTFVHEGAGWENSLGYYTYPTDKPPQSINDITDKTIIFPNASYSSTGLQAGDKVQLLYLNKEKQEYTTIFPAGISVGWFLIAQGWSAANYKITSGLYTHYSNANLNKETNPDLRKHNVLLWDDERELLLIGFEDIKRDISSCDQDFNDAIFFATVNPLTAIDNSLYQPIDTPEDSDSDGISDVFDQYPTDASKAFGNDYPAKDMFGTLVFEDLWPYKGDYDFNDLVVDYNFSQATNSQNQVTSIRAKIVVRAIGATYHNALGLQINTTPENVSSVSGARNTKGYLDISGNGTENNQSKAVVMIFDDAFNALPYPGSGIGVNVTPLAPYVNPDTIILEVNFLNPVNYASLGTPPYNPFIVIDRNRMVEVHLPGSSPTDLADLKLLGTGDDDSNANIGKYYMSDNYYPWCINLPVSFNYQVEKMDITKAHLMFSKWALSRGYNYMDWYMEKPGYRDINNIYSK